MKREPTCRHCKRRFAVVVDHIKPLSQGGTNDPANLQSLCKACHDHLTATHDGGFGRPTQEGKPH